MSDIKKSDMNRRKFIKGAGMAVGTIGISSTVPKLLKPLNAATKDYILVGRPLPLTGPVAAFTESTPWLDDKMVAAINSKGGIYIKEYGKKLPIRMKIVDTQSNPSKAAEVAARLITKDKVDMMYVSATPATVSPVASVCDRYGLPSISTMMPNEMFLHGGPYKWAFNASFSVGDFASSFIEAWDKVPTNKVVALCAQNDADGIAWSKGAARGLEAAGYKIVDMGRFPVGTNDYSAQINFWKQNKAEIMFSNMAPPDFTTAWRQCMRSGFVPKISTAGRAGMFSTAMAAIGGYLAEGITAEACWHPSFPFKSSLTGESAQEFADAYESKFEKQWTQPLGGCHAGYEVLYEVLNRAQTLNRDAIRTAFYDVNFDSMQGPTQFKSNNVAHTPSACLQWVRGKRFKYDGVIVGNGKYNYIKTTARTIPIQRG